VNTFAEIEYAKVRFLENNILLFFLILIIILLVVFLVEYCIVFTIYRKKKVGKAQRIPLKIALKLMPGFITIFSAFFKDKKDNLRRIYIELNNILVENDCKKYSGDRVLVLLPHCLQYSECPHRITVNIDNCRRCGKCSIGSILDYVIKNKIQARVVTGGTVARSLVDELNPEMVVSVACERDLMSGIADVNSVPVLGILNKRPNGPCFNTEVDVDEIKKKIAGIIKK
jgi:hypothetical protein